MTDIKLADQFPAAQHAQWRALVDKALKGGDFERRLVSRTLDNIRIEPLYTRATLNVAATGMPGEAPMTRGLAPPQPRAGWDIRQLHADDDPARANAAILDDLAGGVTSVMLRVAAPGQFGLPYEGDAIARTLKGVHLDVCPVALDAGEYTPDAAGALIALWRQAGLAETQWHGAFNYDPLGNLARTGALYNAIPKALAIAADLVVRCKGTAVQAVMADGRPYHEAGASEAQELAAMLATLVAYLRAAEAAGMSPDAALPHIAVGLAADADQLLTIAKLRAARHLVWRIAEASGAGEAVAAVRIAVTTSERMMAERDPWVNMLRTTMACAAAAMGGADAITVLPFTWALGRPDAFARRIARNTHHVLIEESGLDRVIDPAGGSFAMEELTDKLAREAWALFQEIEAGGGMAAALTSGAIAKRIAATATERDKAIATGRLSLTGTSAFPRLGDDGVTADPHPAPLPATLNGATIAPLRARRVGAAFEALRNRADAMAAGGKAPPTVFLASLGPLAVHSARTTWIANFLAAGGIAVKSGDGFTNSADAGRAFAESGCRIACICSSDDVYGELGEATASALKGAGAASVYLAGRPKEQESALAAAGVDAFLYAGMDAVTILAKLLDDAGAAR